MPGVFFIKVMICSINNDHEPIKTQRKWFNGVYCRSRLLICYLDRSLLATHEMECLKRIKVLFNHITERFIMTWRFYIGCLRLLHGTYRKVLIAIQQLLL